MGLIGNGSYRLIEGISGSSRLKEIQKKNDLTNTAHTQERVLPV